MINLLTRFAAGGCSNFLGFPTWYEYLDGTCKDIKINGINDVWLIVAAVIEILLRIAALFAVAFVIYGGFQYLTSQAEPDKLNKAKNTIINSLVGLVVAVLSAALVGFIAGRIN